MIEIAPGKPVWAMGLMCGTSMDGVDAALLETDGERIWSFGESCEISPAYNAAQREALARLGQEIAADRLSAVAAEALETCAAFVDRIHAAAVAMLGARADMTCSAVGYHGQTVYHAPADGWTCQAGDGARLAERTGLPVVWDFRSEDMDAGGEGAPLAPFYHFALARRIGATEPLAFLNIGGVGNVTWIDPRHDKPEDDGALVAFDTGPGNALINDWMAARGGTPMDRDGQAAAAGTVHAERLRSNFGQSYLQRRPPKSLDRDDFSAARVAMEGLTTEDGAATLTRLTADCIAAAVSHMPAPPSRWLVCGGGRHNPTMMAMLRDGLHAPVEPVEAAGLDGDMLEAQAFAFLAVRVLRGLPTSAPSTTGCDRPVSGGRIDMPPVPVR